MSEGRWERRGGQGESSGDRNSKDGETGENSYLKMGVPHALHKTSPSEFGMGSISWGLCEGFVVFLRTPASTKGC